MLEAEIWAKFPVTPSTFTLQLSTCHWFKKCFLVVITAGAHSTETLGSSKSSLPTDKCCRWWRLDSNLGFSGQISDWFPLLLLQNFLLQHQDPEHLSLFTPSSRENTFLQCFEVLTQQAQWWETFNRQKIAVGLLNQTSKPKMTNCYQSDKNGTEHIHFPIYLGLPPR